MEKGRLFRRAARMVGTLLMFATAFHVSLGTAEVLQSIKVGSVAPSFIMTFKNIWIFSSVMLFLSGVWVFFLVRDLGQLRRRAWWQGVLIGLGYVGGAIGAMAWAGVQPHLVAFAMIGLLLLIPLLLKAGAFKGESNEKSLKTEGPV